MHKFITFYLGFPVVVSRRVLIRFVAIDFVAMQTRGEEEKAEKDSNKPKCP